MAFSQTRFLWNGWVEELYLKPTFHFTFWGFDWIKPLPEFLMYGLVVSTLLLALMVAAGLLYRWAIILFFLAFTYMELIDVALYLNHYYFISLVAFLMIFLPANSGYSLDAYFGKSKGKAFIPTIYPEIIKWQLTIVYFFAGMAKIRPDWLLEAQPLKIWLSTRADFPVMGPLLELDWVAYFFSWSGMIYDCTTPFFLFNKKTRPFAFITVVIFHVTTWLLFNIGMFPWIMIASTLIFFDVEDWKKIMNILRIKLCLPSLVNLTAANSFKVPTIMKWGLIIYFVLQLLVPLRQYFYPGNSLWTELGYRFSWNVMLVEKTGYCHFVVRDNSTHQSWTILPKDYLTVLQEKQMSFQPDMIWQFAQKLKKNFARKGYEDLSVFVYNKVSLNGGPSNFLIDPNMDLLAIKTPLDLHKVLLFDID